MSTTFSNGIALSWNHNKPVKNTREVSRSPVGAIVKLTFSLISHSKVHPNDNTEASRTDTRYLPTTNTHTPRPIIVHVTDQDATQPSVARSTNITIIMTGPDFSPRWVSDRQASCKNNRKNKPIKIMKFAFALRSGGWWPTSVSGKKNRQPVLGRMGPTPRMVKPETTGWTKGLIARVGFRTDGGLASDSGWTMMTVARGVYGAVWLSWLVSLPCSEVWFSTTERCVAASQPRVGKFGCDANSDLGYCN